MLFITTTNGTAHFATAKPEGHIMWTAPDKEVCIQIGRGLADLDMGLVECRVQTSTRNGQQERVAVVTNTLQNTEAWVKTNNGRYYEVYRAEVDDEGTRTLITHPRMAQMRRYAYKNGINANQVMTKHVVIAVLSYGMPIGIGGSADLTELVKAWIVEGYTKEKAWIEGERAKMAFEPVAAEDDGEIVVRTPNHGYVLDIDADGKVRTTERNAVAFMLDTEDPAELLPWMRTRIEHAEKKGRVPELVHAVIMTAVGDDE